MTERQHKTTGVVALWLVFSHHRLHFIFNLVTKSPVKSSHSHCSTFDGKQNFKLIIMLDNWLHDFCDLVFISYMLCYLNCVTLTEGRDPDFGKLWCRDPVPDDIG